MDRSHDVVGVEFDDLVPFPREIYCTTTALLWVRLHGQDRIKGTPICLREIDQVISTVMAKEDVGLANFQHIHHASIKQINGKMYIIAQAWNPGDFSILEQVQ